MFRRREEQPAGEFAAGHFFWALGSALTGADKPAAAQRAQSLTYKAVVDLGAQALYVSGLTHTLTPGMAVTAEIKLGTRSVMEYLLSPVQGAFHEAGRER